MEELTTETQRHRERTTRITKTRRSGEQEGFFSPVYLMLSSVPLCLCGELFWGGSSHWEGQAYTCHFTKPQPWSGVIEIAQNFNGAEVVTDYATTRMTKSTA